MFELKYIKIKPFNEIIVFPGSIEHKRMGRGFNVSSAGFISISSDKAICSGESVSLDLKSDPKDSFLATKQLLGITDETLLE